ncbi:MAG: cytochrome b/b6 domain-containing protein [Burkholderiaceae bacterium]|nr:cytochrome b/b6 domain-containing protein [Burkholderiaceae bacterium]
MQAPSTLDGPATAAMPSSRPAAARRRRVVDAPTRMFHWLFALSFAGAYLTADGERWRALHVTLGYVLAGLLVFRLVYGLVGPRHARLSLLLRKLQAAPAWLSAMADGVRQRGLQGLPWRQGQNLLMALAVVALLALTLPLTLSGYASLNDWGAGLGGDWLEELHEFFGNAFLALVLAHLGLIAGLSLLRRRNQAQAMLTGHIDGPGPDLVRRNHGWLAALLLLAVLAFGAWQWQQAPAGLAADCQASYHRDEACTPGASDG